ncbi:MAG: trypsin-like peptidase domain-containing protein [Planctomycetota bacterium]
MHLSHGHCLSVLVMAAFAWNVGSTAPAEFHADVLQNRIYSTIEAVKPAVVTVGQRGGTFSGVIVSKEGHVLSAGHAVRPGGRYQITLQDGRRFTARGKGSNSQADCALLQISGEVGDLPYVEMGESNTLVRNQPCLSVSFPGGQGTRGIPLVRFGRIVRTRRGDNMFQSTALMEPGDSGGALFDLHGRVIGIHSRIGRGMERNFEVPIDTFKAFWSELNREQSFTESGPPVPKLGFRGSGLRDRSGVEVTSVLDGTLAAQHGLKAKDIIQSAYGRQTSSIAELRNALVAARDEGAMEMLVVVLREEETLELRMPFDVEREAAPRVELPDYGDTELPTPEAIEELASLPRQFTELESRLDDACVEIRSALGEDEDATVLGTLIKGTRFVLSKSSMVHQEPTTEISGVKLRLEVVARDSINDLVLMQSPQRHEKGIDLNGSTEKASKVGLFLLSPDPTGPGLVSVLSRLAFESRKQQSRGFLGVMPADYQDNAGAILREITKDGAAERAGLEVGDVVTKLNEQRIRTQTELRSFLRTVDPNETIVAVIMRGDDELQKTIRLGAFPSFSGHAADQMEKSGRRDGFRQVISHDADLDPSNCGGPLFDLSGHFLGLNIARNSRVRSYAVTPMIVRQFVEKTRNE